MLSANMKEAMEAETIRVNGWERLCSDKEMTS